MLRNCGTACALPSLFQVEVRQIQMLYKLSFQKRILHPNLHHIEYRRGSVRGWDDFVNIKITMIIIEFMNYWNIMSALQEYRRQKVFVSVQVETAFLLSVIPNNAANYFW